MSQDVLKLIIEKKKERLRAAQALCPLEEMKARAAGISAACRPFGAAIAKPRQIGLVAEIKKASPSAGLIRQDFDPRSIARVYEEAQVQAISVLTEEDYFQAEPAFLSAVREVTTVPLLRKDFIVDPYQVYESRVLGADAILLIAECLTRETLSELMALARALGMETLVEAHEEKELKKVVNLKAPIIGINNRNLRTLQVDTRIIERYYPMIPKGTITVVESGLKSRSDVSFLKILGVNAVLIGEVFLSSPDIRRKVEEVMGW